MMRYVAADNRRVLALLAVLLVCTGCQTIFPFQILRRPAPAPVPVGAQWEEIPLIVTGYCSCGKCCGWTRNWRGQPVYSSGRSKGKPKLVGITSSGTRARKGTIAADIRFFPYGTRMFIPGHGYGVVEDIGGAIKGKRLDLYFPSHQAALNWGKRIRMARVLIAPKIRPRPQDPAAIKARKKKTGPAK